MMIFRHPKLNEVEEAFSNGYGFLILKKRTINVNESRKENGKIKR